MISSDFVLDPTTQEQYKKTGRQRSKKEEKHVLVNGLLTKQTKKDKN